MNEYSIFGGMTVVAAIVITLLLLKRFRKSDKQRREEFLERLHGWKRTADPEIVAQHEAEVELRASNAMILREMRTKRAFEILSALSTIGIAVWAGRTINKIGGNGCNKH
jgi:hypothetical protein